MYGYIYETTNFINGKKYIGQKKSKIFLNDRYLGSGVLITKAIEKYGRQNFSVKLIERCDTKEFLNKREIYWIDFFDAVNSKNYYNIHKGGTTYPSRKGSKMTEEQKRRISEATKKAMQRPEVRKKLANARKNNHLSNFKGKCHSEASKKKLSDSLKQTFNTTEYKMKKSIIMKKALNNPETKKKMSESRKKRITEDSTRKKHQKNMINRYSNPDERVKTSELTKKSWEKRRLLYGKSGRRGV